MTTIAELILDRVKEHADRTAIVYEDRAWSWAEYAQACADRASVIVAKARPGPLHVGVLLDNVPEFPMWLGAAALTGATIVGVNPTRRGAELARDITHTECQLIVTEPVHQHLLDGLDLGLSEDRVLDVESNTYAELVSAHRGAPLPDARPEPGSRLLLLFTSGTSGQPKACICSQGRLGRIGEGATAGFGLTPDDVVYEVMPLFHSNALMAGWAPTLGSGAAMALRRKFSASGFLADVRRFRATYFNYVGKPLSYILATPEAADDADNPLVFAFGNEAADRDIDRFGVRFGCTVIDNYGSTEGGVFVRRTPDTPPGALGRASEDTVVLGLETGEECPPAEFDDQGRLLNPDAAIGELSAPSQGAGFEGYWNNEEADAQRVRDGVYRTGDLAYRDAQGFFYFAGRDFDWLRVDGENFAAAPVERIIARHPDVLLAAVYAVPDPEVGDQVMATLQLQAGRELDPVGFADFLAMQPDLGTKWAPCFVRVTPQLPVTPTSKVLKRGLRREAWECDDPVWWRPKGEEHFRRMTPRDVAELRALFTARGRLSALEASG
jgi:fatty-acyl-CoA synthase